MANEFGKKVHPLLKDFYSRGSAICAGDALDIGCAHGANSKWLFSLGFNVIGIDKSLPRELLDCANINFIEMSALDFKFTENSYSLIVATNVLQFFLHSDKYQILASIAKSLKPGGVFICQSFTVNEPSFKNALERGLKEVEKNSFYIKEHDFSKSYFELGELLVWAKGLSLEVLLSKEEVTKDNHPPIGNHSHGIVSLIVRK